jgi:hypothetical protein
MRIGELLVEQRKLRQSELTRALADKPADKRLCSFLILRGLVDFDDASKALGEQKGVPCALTKHLAGRDPELAALIPAELGRASCALPIGKTSRGAVIVCVRDPSPSLLASLKQATKAEITMVIAPANRLEHLVLTAYGAAPSDEFDVDFSTTGVGDNVAVPQPLAKKLASAVKAPPMPDMSALDPASVRLALTDLDDVRVDKDPSQSGQVPKVGASSTLPPPNVPAVPAAPALPPHTMPAMGRTSRAQTGDPRATRPMSIGAMSVGLEHTQSREGATDLVLAYVATRWLSGLVLAIRDKKAIGYRGHGVSMPELVQVPLEIPSTVQRAVETRFVSAESPRTAAQEALVRALGEPAMPAAAPVLVGGLPVAVILVGDAIDGDANAAADLAMLAEALGTAYQRISAR